MAQRKRCMTCCVTKSASRKPRCCPTAAIIDSQSVKTSCNVSESSQGIDAGKKIKAANGTSPPMCSPAAAEGEDGENTEDKVGAGTLETGGGHDRLLRSMAPGQAEVKRMRATETVMADALPRKQGLAGTGLVELAGCRAARGEATGCRQQPCHPSPTTQRLTARG
ncbi:hypothetical protein [Kibdelosporangium philippinense]|uniref:hypothetical protein n=1 Tax=Kibdelosporangium philippinense TaxID=211113 RepID=UPI0036065267